MMGLSISNPSAKPKHKLRGMSINKMNNRMTTKWTTEWQQNWQQKTSRYRIITIIKWDEYQINEQQNEQQNEQ
jgi:hypothetical protein